MYQVNKYLVCQYRYGGRNFPYLDCWGLVLNFYKNELNIDLPLNESVKDMSTDVENTTKRQIKYCEIKESDLGADTVYIACFYCNNKLKHCGVVVNKRILHTTNTGTCYKSIRDTKISYKLWKIKYYEVKC